MCECEFYDRLVNILSACLTRHDYKCPARRKTISCKENNAEFICKIEPDEIGCLFVVDPQHGGNCRNNETANCLNLNTSCDFILFVNTNRSGDSLKSVVNTNRSGDSLKSVVNTNPSGDSLKSVTFIELKGSDVNHAIKQIKETIKVFIREFPKSVWGYKIFAVIIYTGSAPKKTKDKELKELLDKFPFLKKRNQGDITLYVKQLE